MAEGFAQIPADVGGGTKVRTRERTIGANAIEEQYVLSLATERVRSAAGTFCSGAHVVQAAADAALAGRWFLFNNVGSSTLLAVKRVVFRAQLGSALATPTSPRIALVRMTFTGTPSGAVVTPGLRRSTEAFSANISLRTASTGATLTNGATVAQFFTTANATAVGNTEPAEARCSWDAEDDALVLAAGEGLYLTQLDAGTTADTRRYTTDVYCEEFTLP